MLFISSLLTAQTKFEQGMGKAFQLWDEGKNTEASAMFERIAAAEKTLVAKLLCGFSKYHNGILLKKTKTNRFVIDKSTKCLGC